MDEKFNASGRNGRDCPVCFRTGTLAGERVDRATLECSGCFARFLFIRGPEGSPDTLQRIRLSALRRTPPGAAVAMVLLAALITMAGCADTPTPIRGTGTAVQAPAGWTDYCDRHPADPSCLEVYR